MEVTQVLRQLGISATYHGHWDLVFAVELAIEDEEILLEITKLLYPAIAKKRRTTPYCVERNIRTAIRVCWEKGNHAYLNQIAGYQVIKKPTAGEFIDILANYMSRQAKAV